MQGLKFFVPYVHEKKFAKPVSVRKNNVLFVCYKGQKMNVKHCFIIAFYT